MDVTQYLFKSPSTSQVQIGRPDPTSKPQTEEQQVQQQSFASASAKEQPEFTPSQSSDAPSSSTPEVNSSYLLDVYA